jgi:hypothetical protein
MDRFSLEQVLALVGRLDDSKGQNTARERFRQFLVNSVPKVGQLRDYVEECLRKTGDNYDRALQDLINYLGQFLEFEVTYGRYQGVRGEIGFDGYWKSPEGFHIVVEVKTSEVFAINASTLVGYVDALISEKKIPSWDKTLGLYVIGRPNPNLRQLENAIIAEKRTDQLRVISVDALLSLVELMSKYDIGHEDILAVIYPSGPRIDPVVDLMASLVAETEAYPKETTEKEPGIAESKEEFTWEGKPNHWITSVSSDEDATAEETIQTLVGETQIYAFGDRTPGRKKIKPGDWICFYISGGTGVAAYARVASTPENAPHPKVRHSKKYSWVFELTDTNLYLDQPVVIDAEKRTQLEAFEDKDPNANWAWFVQSTHQISAHDFKMLTR